MNFLKGIVKYVLIGIACLMIISGGLTCIESLSAGFPIAGGGVAIIVVLTILQRRKDTKEIRDKAKDNHCKNCGHTLQGAQYRYYYGNRDIFGDIDLNLDIHDLPVTVYVKCPKCGLEKEIKFNVLSPIMPRTSREKEEVYVQESIRKTLERILKDD